MAEVDPFVAANIVRGERLLHGVEILASINNVIVIVDKLW